MMDLQNAPVLPLDDIVDIIINLSRRAMPRRGFNLPLLVGTSDVIPANERVRLYASADAMLEDGFGDDDPEYIAARLVFSQRQRPPRVDIGRRDAATGLGQFEITVEANGSERTITWEHIPDGGNGFAYLTMSDVSTFPLPQLGDILPGNWPDIVSGQFMTGVSPNSDVSIIVAEIDASRAVVALGAAIVAASGGGASVGQNIGLNLPPAESAADAVRACRRANTEWWAASCLGATVSDILGVAQYIESAKPNCVQMYTTDDAAAITNQGRGSVFETLRLKSFRRSFGQWSQTPYAVCGIMGFAMGLNSQWSRGFSRSAYTLMFKEVVGIMPDVLSENQLAALQRQNANYYAARGFDGEYQMMETGAMADGTWFDEMVGLDMLANNMQKDVLDLLKRRNKIPQTEGGVNEIKMGIEPSLRRQLVTGFLAPGKWWGPSIYTQPNYAPLQTGDMLEHGYMILSEPITLQPLAEREARLAPPIYVPVKLAGAIHNVVIRVDVER